jgi:murein L,D-transpeptidase YafK
MGQEMPGVIWQYRLMTSIIAEMEELWAHYGFIIILEQINSQQFEFWHKWKNQECQFAENKQFG